MSDKLKVYVESSFVCYLTGDQTANAKISADQAYIIHYRKRLRLLKMRVIVARGL